MQIKLKSGAGWKVAAGKDELARMNRVIEDISPLAEIDGAPCHDEAKTATECLRHIAAYLETGTEPIAE